MSAALNMGYAEAYYVNRDGEGRVQIIEAFEMPERKMREPISDYKERVTRKVLAMCGPQVRQSYTHVLWRSPMYHNHHDHR